MNTIQRQGGNGKITGWGADRRQEDRPGVPAEMDPPRPMGNAHWTVPETQRTGDEPVIGAMRRLTPVYATAVPLRGLSGLVRRAGYRLPDYRASRWLVLMIADRIDVIEHNAAPLATLLIGGGLLGAGVLALRSSRR